MATLMNPFDLLDDNIEDPSLFIAAQEKLEPKKAPSQPVQPSKAAPKLPSKPLPPSQAVREARSDAGRGGGNRGRGRGRGFNREIMSTDNGGKPSEEGDAGRLSERRGYGGPRGSFRGGRRGGFSNGDDAGGDRPRRVFDRRSGAGRGNDFKRDGSGRGNWGTPNDELAPATEETVNENEKAAVAEKQPGETDGADANNDTPANESEEKEPEDKEMTLEEYEKVLEEKKKALLALKAEERKVVMDKELQSMQPLSKKANDEVFIKLGSDKEKRKDASEKEERAKKSLSINEFLKPADGERYSGPGGRGRGRGRGSRGSYGGGYRSNMPAPSIEDPGHFPALAAK